MSDSSGLTDQLQLNKEQYEISYKQKEQDKQQENVNKLQTKNRQTTQQKVKNNALNNTDNLSKSVILSSEELEKILTEADGEEEIIEKKEGTLTLVETTYTVPIVSETINKPSFKTENSLFLEKQGQKVEQADDTKIIENSEKIEAQKKDEAQERLENQPEKLRENYTALLTLMKEVKESCQRESGAGNSEFMNNVISQVTSFEAYINSKEFNISNPGDYMKRFIDMRSTISTYYEKNKGTKWTAKGRRRRDLTRSILERLNGWVDNLPKTTIEANMAKEMVYVDNLKNLLATMSDKKYGTSDDAGTWFSIQRAGEAFFNNLDEKNDEEAGAALASLFKSAQRYLGTHAGKRRTQKGQDRVDFAKNIVSSISGILKNGTSGTRLSTFDAILENQNQVTDPKDAQANELTKDFLAQYAIGEMQAIFGTETGTEDYFTEKTFMYMHNREKFYSVQNSIRYLTKGDLEKTIFGRGNSSDNMGKNFLLNRHGKVDPKYANDAKLAELAVNRALKADPADATYISRSTFVKELEQIKITPEMFTREYLDSHYLEMRHMLNSITNIQNTFNDWKGECYTACNKEFNSYPPKIQKKLDMIYLWEHAVGEYYVYSEKLSGFSLRDGFYIENIHEIKETIQAGIPQEMDKKTNQEEKLDYMNEKMERYAGVDFLYEQVEVSPGKLEVRDILEAKLIKAKRLYEENKNDLVITEEDIKTVRYFAYEDEAKKESERLGVTITPEAVAMSKMIKTLGNYVKQEVNNPENKALQEVLKGEKFNRIYSQKIRYVNYDKDGNPATEEDKKNLEWNKAYAKSILENKQEDRIRLLKENSEYIADLINQVDFDRVLDFDYWNNNKDLYITLTNFSLTGLAFDVGNCLPEDSEILRKYYKQNTPMIKLLNDFVDVLTAIDTFQGVYGKTLRVEKQSGDYRDSIDSEQNLESDKAMADAFAMAIKERIEIARKSNIDYIASKQRI